MREVTSAGTAWYILCPHILSCSRLSAAVIVTFVLVQAFTLGMAVSSALGCPHGKQQQQQRPWQKTLISVILTGFLILLTAAVLHQPRPSLLPS